MKVKNEIRKIEEIEKTVNREIYVIKEKKINIVSNNLTE